jgi:hypothetical protein
MGEIKGIVDKIEKEVGMEEGGMMEDEVEEIGKRIEDVREKIENIEEVEEEKEEKRDM